jgi:hypothetical protein
MQQKDIFEYELSFAHYLSACEKCNPVATIISNPHIFLDLYENIKKSFEKYMLALDCAAYEVESKYIYLMSVNKPSAKSHTYLAYIDNLLPCNTETIKFLGIVTPRNEEFHERVSAMIVKGIDWDYRRWRELATRK